MTRDKCAHCELRDSAEPCRGGRFCALTDPAHPDYNPSYLGRGAVDAGRRPAEASCCGSTVAMASAEPVAGPGLVRMAANFAGAMVQHAQAGFPYVTDEVAARRLAICRSNKCGYYGAGDRCLHANCGCFLVMKTTMADQACPLVPPLWGPGDYLDERGVTPE